MIKMLGEYRPPRTWMTKCLFVHGPPGVGKSVSTLRTLRALSKLYSPIDYYVKVGGLNKWWDGYDNQPIVCIDDPGMFNPQYNDDAIAFKTAISAEAMKLEIKGGVVQFDSRLVIVLSNAAPELLAESSGPYHTQAVLDRLTGTRSCKGKAVYITKKQDRDRLITYITNIVKEFVAVPLGVDIHSNLVLTTVHAMHSSPLGYDYDY